MGRFKLPVVTSLFLTLMDFIWYSETRFQIFYLSIKKYYGSIELTKPMFAYPSK